MMFFLIKTNFLNATSLWISERCMIFSNIQNYVVGEEVERNSHSRWRPVIAQDANETKFSCNGTSVNPQDWFTGLVELVDIKAYDQ